MRLRHSVSGRCAQPRCRCSPVPTRRLTRVVIVLAVVLLATAGAVVGWRWKTSGSRVVRGSATVDFVTTTTPAPPRPKKIVQAIPWPTYGYDLARTRVAPPAFSERPPFRVVWQMRAGNYIEFPPVIAYGRVYLDQEDGRFFALDADTGRILWEHNYLNCSAASPAVGNGVVYEPFLPRPCDYGPRTVPAFLAAFDAKTGKNLWRFTMTGGSESSPLLIGHVLYFGSWDHHLYALDVRSRSHPRLLWRYQTDGEIDSSPASAGGVIYIGDNGGRLYALNAASGLLRWTASSFSNFISGREYFYAAPAVAYGRVYVGNTDGTEYAFSAGSGKLLWAQHAGSYVYAAAAIWNKTVYVGSYDGTMYALDAATGDIRWRYDAPSAIHGAPTILNGLLYFSTCGTCGHRGSRYAKQGARGTYAIDATTGKLVWSFPDGKYSPLVADNQRIYIAGQTRLYALVPTRSPASKALVKP
jgi:outer membrane protein assembly factor BamB